MSKLTCDPITSALLIISDCFFVFVFCIPNTKSKKEKKYKYVSERQSSEAKVNTILWGSIPVYIQFILKYCVQYNSTKRIKGHYFD